MDDQAHTIGKAIRPLFADPVWSHMRLEKQLKDRDTLIEQSPRCELL